MSCHKLSSPNADFAFALYKNLNAKAVAGKNIFYSPLGISTALSTLSAGAHGETHSQLFSSLGYSTLNQTQVSEAYEHLFDMHGHSHENQQLDVGNAVALRSCFNPLEKFLKDVKHHYSGEVLNISFTNPAEAAAEINRYIANKTHDKIKDMVKDLDPDMAMMLINYVYLKDNGLRAPSLEKQTGVPAPEQRNTVLWTGRRRSSERRHSQQCGSNICL